MGNLYIVATPIGNLGDISFRALEILKSCDIIAAEDTRYTLRLLNHYNIKTKLLSYYKYNEKDRSKQIIKYLTEENFNVAVVSNAGTPCISDPGKIIVKAARENNIPVYGISGPSAFTTALSISGLPAKNFYFIGFLPRDTSEIKKCIEDLKKKKIETFILYESPYRIQKLAALLLAEFPNSTVCFCSDMSKKREKSYYGTIAKVNEMLLEDINSNHGEYTVVVNTAYQGDPKIEVRIEALLLDVILKNNCSLKESIKLVSESYNISRSEAYNASLELKNFINNYHAFDDS